MYQSDHKILCPSWIVSMMIVLISLFLGCAIGGGGGGGGTTSNFGWVKTIGGSDTDSAQTVATDLDGNVYLAGWYSGLVNFDTGGGFDNKDSNGSTDIFVTKIDPIGNYSWTRTMGGTLGDQANGIATDPDDNVFITGSFQDTATFNGSGDSKTSNGSNDIFITKINANGTYAWTKTIGGTEDDSGNAIVTDSSGNIYVAGTFRGTVDFDFTAGTDNKVSKGLSDIFITKINSDATYGWTRTIGGTQQDAAYAVTRDPSDNIFIAGSFNGSANFNTDGGTDNKTSKGSNDIFVTKLGSGGAYAWTRTAGSTTMDTALGITADKNGTIYVAGFFTGSIDFDPDGIGDPKVSAGNSDAFLMKLFTDGSYGGTAAFGGTGSDLGYSVAADSDANIYMSGAFSDTVDLDLGPALDERISNGDLDAFMIKVLSDGNFGWAQSFGGTGTDTAYSVAVDPTKNVYSVGQFSDTVIFGQDAFSSTKVSQGAGDIFIVKYTQ